MTKKKVTKQVIGKTLNEVRYFFPEYGQTVTATNQAEAEAKVKKLKGVK
jgi:hypothetical protein